jgi:nucleoid-associated protein YgaU
MTKLTITPEKASKLAPIEVSYNPNAYSISKSVTWNEGTGDGRPAAKTDRRKNAPAREFGGGQSRTLSLELFFDTTEEKVEAKKDVRILTNQVAKLTRIVRDMPKKPRPPICVITWGPQTQKGYDLPFTGVLTQLGQRFNLFLPDGRPVRATLSVTFTEWLDPKKDAKETDPEFTTRLVKRGDTLSSIAGEVYRDPTMWRVIAEANRLDDPRQVAVGLRLDIPKTD